VCFLCTDRLLIMKTIGYMDFIETERWDLMTRSRTLEFLSLFSLRFTFFLYSLRSLSLCSLRFTSLVFTSLLYLYSTICYVLFLFVLLASLDSCSSSLSTRFLRSFSSLSPFMSFFTLAHASSSSLPTCHFCLRKQLEVGLDYWPI